MCSAAPRKKRLYAIPRALGTVACYLGFVINFFAKPASRAQSLRTPSAGKAMNRAKRLTKCQNEIEFSLEYFDYETIGFY